jgi:hypothetical protein
MTWRQIERALADYVRSLGIELESDGRGEIAVELATTNAAGDDEPVGFLLSDLAKHLERELA